MRIRTLRSSRLDTDQESQDHLVLDDPQVPDIFADHDAPATAGRSADPHRPACGPSCHTDLTTTRTGRSDAGQGITIKIFHAVPRLMIAGPV
jgi:hypothetical protein